MKNSKPFKFKRKPSENWNRLEKRMAAPWWKKLLRIALLSITVCLFASCEPEPINATPATVTYTSNYEIPSYLIGEYILHAGKEKHAVLSISETDITLLNEFSYTYTTIFVNGDCWVIIYLDNGLELRISDYIKEKNFVVLSLWEIGQRIKEYGVYDKLINQ